MTSSAPPERNRSPKGRRGPKRSDTPAVSDAHQADAEYRVGPGRPPKEHQFKPGQSGNPKGAKRKSPSIAPDLKALLERALSNSVKLGNGEKERIITKAAAGIESLVNQFASGDRHARRDLIVLAGKLGVDLTAGHSIENTIVTLYQQRIKRYWTIMCEGMGAGAMITVVIIMMVGRMVLAITSSVSTVKKGKRHEHVREHS